MDESTTIIDITTANESVQQNEIIIVVNKLLQ